MPLSNLNGYYSIWFCSSRLAILISYYSYRAYKPSFCLAFSKTSWLGSPLLTHFTDLNKTLEPTPRTQSGSETKPMVSSVLKMNLWCSYSKWLVNRWGVPFSCYHPSRTKLGYSVQWIWLFSSTNTLIALLASPISRYWSMPCPYYFVLKSPVLTIMPNPLLYKDMQL